MDEQKWPELMTVAEIARILKVSRMTVYRLVNAGEFGKARITPRTIRVSADALRAYLERL